MNSTIAGRLKQAGLVLPALAPPKYQFLSATRAGGLLFLSGKTPQRDGQVVHPGRLGAELGPELGREAARIAALNLLAAIEHEVGLEHVRFLAKVTTFVASADGFTQQPLVADAASELLVEILGDAGRHARSAIGVAWLPGNAAVEIEAIAEVSS
jgi:enamine deaminase RidA (YjgF/YER057c/UK114 family)